jgi:hypothetical protein
MNTIRHRPPAWAAVLGEHAEPTGSITARTARRAATLARGSARLVTSASRAGGMDWICGRRSAQVSGPMSLSRASRPLLPLWSVSMTPRIRAITVSAKTPTPSQREAEYSSGMIR